MLTVPLSKMISLTAAALGAAGQQTGGARARGAGAGVRCGGTSGGGFIRWNAGTGML